ncbi:MAG: hypothetical protein ACUVRY_04480 [Thermoanaerobaculaceae bacterium]
MASSRRLLNLAPGLRWFSPFRSAWGEGAWRGKLRHRIALAFAFFFLLAFVSRHVWVGPGMPAPLEVGVFHLWGSGEQSDLPLQFAVWWEEVRRLARQAEPPWITDRIGAGVPLLGNGQTGLPFPLQLPVWLWGPERGTTVMAFLKLLFAFWGMKLWLGRLRALPPGRLLGALAYAFSLDMVSWLPVPLSWVLAAAPWVLWLLVGALRGSPRQAAGLALLLGVLLGWSLHPETAAFLALASAFLGICLAWPKFRRAKRLFLPLSLAVVIGLGFGLPVVLTIRDSAKYHAPPPAALNLSLSEKLELASLFLVPFRHGNPGAGHFAFPFPHAPLALACGSAVWLLLLAGNTQRRHRRWFWAFSLLALGSLGLFFQVGAVREVALALPVLNRMTWPRLGFLLPLALITLAALRFPRTAPKPAKLISSWLILQGVVLALSWTADAGTGLWVWPTAFFPSLAALVLWKKPAWLPVLAFLEVTWWSAGVFPLSRPGSVDPLLADLAASARWDERAVAIGESVPANLLARAGVVDLRSHDPVRPQTLAALHHALGSQGEDLPGPLTKPWAGLAGAWGVKWLLTGPEGLPQCCQEGWELVREGRQLKLFRNLRWQPPLRAASQLVYPPGDPELGEWEHLDFAEQAVVTGTVSPGTYALPSWEVVDRRPWRLHLQVRTSGPALLLWHVPYTVGWKTLVDTVPRKPIIANLGAMAVVVPEGEHEVVWVYHPPGLILGWSLGGLGLLVTVAWMRRRRHEKVP